MTELANKLFYGDNLGILRSFDDRFADLVYLDPPFNSNADYNVILRDESGNRSDATRRQMSTALSNKSPTS